MIKTHIMPGVWSQGVRGPRAAADAQQRRPQQQMRQGQPVVGFHGSFPLLSVILLLIATVACDGSDSRRRTTDGPTGGGDSGYLDTGFDGEETGEKTQGCQRNEDCEDGFDCIGAECIPVNGCPEGLTLCSGECVDLDSSPFHCGFCGVACNQGSTCRSGSCLQTDDCRLTTDFCPDGTYCDATDGNCYPDEPDVCDISDELNGGAAPHTIKSQMSEDLLTHLLWGTDGHSSDDLYISWILHRGAQLPESNSSYSIDGNATVEDCTLCVFIERVDPDWNIQTFLAREGVVKVDELSEGVFKGSLQGAVLYEWDVQSDHAVADGLAWCLPDYSWETSLEVEPPDPCRDWRDPLLAVPNCGAAPLTVAFDGDMVLRSFSDSNVTGIYWDSDDGYTSYATNPTHTYTRPGDYNPKVRVTTVYEGSTINITLEDFIRVH